MYCTQWSRSAGLFSGPFLSMIRRQASWVRSWMELDILRGLAGGDQPLAQRHGRFDRGLGMELRWDS